MLETERLLLRPWRDSDAADLYEVAKDARVGPAAGWPPHKSVEQSRTIIRNVLRFPENYAIVLKETGAVIGSIGLLTQGHTNLPLQKDEGELGAWIGVPYWGNEYVVEAAKALMKHGFEDLGLSRIYGANFEGNKKSERLQEKLGFRYRRTIEDYYVAQLDEHKRLYLRVIVNPEYEI